MDLDSVSTLAAFAGAGAVALIVAVLAALRERSHRRRIDLDRVSFISWSLVSVLFSMLAIILLSTAAKIYFMPAN